MVVVEPGEAVFGQDPNSASPASADPTTKLNGGAASMRPGHLGGPSQESFLLGWALGGPVGVP